MFVQLLLTDLINYYLSKPTREILKICRYSLDMQDWETPGKMGRSPNWLIPWSSMFPLNHSVCKLYMRSAIHLIPCLTIQWTRFKCQIYFIQNINIRPKTYLDIPSIFTFIPTKSHSHAAYSYNPILHSSLMPMSCFQRQIF